MLRFEFIDETFSTQTDSLFVRAFAFALSDRLWRRGFERAACNVGV